MCEAMQRTEAGRTRAFLVASTQRASLWALGRVALWLTAARTQLHALRQRRGRSAPQRASGRAPRATNVASAAPARDDIAALITQLRDPSAEVAAVAALKLGSQPTAEAASALREVLTNADGYFNPLTRVAALQAFTHALPPSPGPNELAPLLALVRDIDAEVSMAAIDAVAQRAPANVAIDRLLPVVLDDSGYFLPSVRAAASRALERAGLLTTASA